MRTLHELNSGGRRSGMRPGTELILRCSIDLVAKISSTGTWPTAILVSKKDLAREDYCATY